MKDRVTCLVLRTFVENEAFLQFVDAVLLVFEKRTTINKNESTQTFMTD
jgi:hypothetical protein